MSASEIEKRLLLVAQEMLRSTGLTVSIEHLSLEELIRIAGVPRSSVYRRWNTKDDFYLDLLVELAKPGPVTGELAWDEDVLALVRGIIDDNQDLMDTDEGRQSLMREVLRQGAEQNYLHLAESTNWRTHTALLATTVSMPEGPRDRVLAALKESEDLFIQQMGGFYSEMLETFRVGLQPGVTPALLAASGAAVMEGLVQRKPVNGDLVETRIPGPGLRGETVEWHVAAVAYYGIVRTMLDPPLPW